MLGSQFQTPVSSSNVKSVSSRKDRHVAAAILRTAAAPTEREDEKDMIEKGVRLREAGGGEKGGSPSDFVPR